MTKTSKKASKNQIWRLFLTFCSKNGHQKWNLVNEKERQEVLEKIKEKYMSKDFILLSKNYSWWDNEEDDIYNE
jgi:hypothetical protein